MLGKCDYLIAAVLIAACFLVYANSLTNSFVWDDEALVVNNTDIRSLRCVHRFFTARLFPGIKGGNFYRPVQSLSYAIDYFFWGLNPFGFHLTNILLHAANAALIYLVLFALTGRREISFMASLLFVVHPINTEAVDYVSGRADLLAALFMYISLFFFIAEKKRSITERSDRIGKAGFFMPSVAFFILSLLTKAAAVILPLLAMLCCFCFEKQWESFVRERRRITKRSWALLAVLVSIPALYLLIRYAIRVSSGEALSSNPYPFYCRFLTSFKVVLLYLKLLVFPFPLHMERVVPMETSIFSPAVFLPIIFLCVIAVVALKAYRISRIAFFGIAWFFIALVPYLNWFPMNAEMAEHWLYVPSVGFFLLAVLGLEQLRRIMPLRFIHIIFVIVLVCLSFITVRRNLDWRDNEAIYTQTARYSPGSPRAHYNLGNIYLEKGQFYRAIEEYGASIRIKPGNARVHGNLGKALLGLGRHQEAIGEFEAAVYLEPSSAGFHNKLGAAYGMAGLHERAILQFKEAIKLDPGLVDAHNNLASVYTNTGRFKEAMTEYEKALAIDPGMIEANFNLGIVYYHLGQPELATGQFEKVLRMKPDFKQAEIWQARVKREKKGKW